MTDMEIGEIVANILRQRFPSAGLIKAEAQSAVDYEGTPILRITAQFQRRLPSPDAPSIAVHEIRTELLNRGEDRFVFLSNEYGDRQEEQEEDVS